MHVKDGLDVPRFVWEWTRWRLFHPLGNSARPTPTKDNLKFKHMKLSDDDKCLQASPVWRHKAIHCQAKLWMYNVSLRADVHCGAEAWPLNNTLAKKIDYFRGRALHIIENIQYSYCISSKELHHLFATASFTTNACILIIANLRFCWCGHIMFISRWVDTIRKIWIVWTSKSYWHWPWTQTALIESPDKAESLHARCSSDQPVSNRMTMMINIIPNIFYIIAKWQKILLGSYNKLFIEAAKHHHTDKQRLHHWLLVKLQSTKNMI